MTAPFSATGVPPKPISTVPSCATASISPYTNPREKPEGQGGTFRFFAGRGRNRVCGVPGQT
eukprot:1761849-Prymnesium_polylepis.1